MGASYFMVVKAHDTLREKKNEENKNMATCWRVDNRGQCFAKKKYSEIVPRK